MARPVRLVVNGDDYGLTDHVSRAVLLAHEAGLVTTTSVIVTTPAFEAAVDPLLAAPELRPGLHLALIGGDMPVSDPARIPTLVDGEGRLHASWKEYLRLAATGRIDHSEVRRELEAQHDRIRASGIAVEHLDSHQNVHLWPATGALVASLAREWGVRAVRTPCSRSFAPAGLAVRGLGRAWRRQVTRHGLTTSDVMVGFDHADRYAEQIRADVRWLAGQGRRQPGLVAELALHLSQPGDDALAAYDWGYDYAGALQAVLSDPVARDLGSPAFERVAWRDLASP